MNKTLLLGTIAFLLLHRVCAQTATILDKNNVPLLPGKVHYTGGVSLKGFSLPGTGRKLIWDYSMLNGDSQLTENYISKIHTPFSKSSTVIIDTNQSEFVVSNRYVKVYKFYDKDDKGWFFAGSYVGAKIINTSSFFNDSGDNIIITDQNDSSRINLINFPDSIGTSHHQKIVKSLHFLWTVKSDNLESTPSVKKTYYTVSDTVVGYGNIRIPAPQTMSIAYPVIMVRRKTIATDSYFVDKKVPNKYFLLAFGITQGKTTVDCNEYFYKSGRQSPLMVIGYGSDTTYRSPKNVKYNTDSIKAEPPLSIVPISESGSDFSLFPNPATSDKISCSLSKPESGTWKILMSNSLGQIVMNNNISAQGYINISLDLSRLSRGLYFISILNENGISEASGKIDLIR